ncbi:MAG: YraN family protein [Actinomycetota bacterium]
MTKHSTSPPLAPKDALGAHGEGLAAEYLRGQGMVILHRNWRCDAGEIDLVARDGDALVICEVKTRRSLSHGTPLEAVGRRKMGKLRHLALRYLTEQRIGPRIIRFDVVGVIQPWDGPPVVQHVRNV